MAPVLTYTAPPFESEMQFVNAVFASELPVMMSFVEADSAAWMADPVPLVALSVTFIKMQLVIVVSVVPDVMFTSGADRVIMLGASHRGRKVIVVRFKVPADDSNIDPLIVSSPDSSNSMLLNVAELTLPLITNSDVPVPLVIFFTLFLTLPVSFGDTT